MSAGWEVHRRHGLWLPQAGWWLDAQRRVDRSFVSHAHSDHIARHREVLGTPATARLLRARLSGRRTVHEIPFGRAHALAPGVTATLHPAGHILGSAQILLEHETHGSLLYTGDFKLRPGLAAENCVVPRADLLVMETTFGLPRYVFPPDAETIARLIEFCAGALAAGATPVLLCYSLGKSQEVLRALAGARLPVMLHRETFRLTQLFEQLGVTFPAYREFSAREAGGHVVICPPQSTGLLAHLPAARTAAVTGWAVDRRTVHWMRCDTAFPLSDHADFNDLLRFVDLVQPKRVLTVHGYAREFAQTLRARGIDALALGHGNQLEFSLPT